MEPQLDAFRTFLLRDCCAIAAERDGRHAEAQRHRDAAHKLMSPEAAEVYGEQLAAELMREEIDKLDRGYVRIRTRTANMRPAVVTRSRSRCSHRSRERRSTRSSARSGDSGSSDGEPGEPHRRHHRQSQRGWSS